MKDFETNPIGTEQALREALEFLGIKVIAANGKTICLCNTLKMANKIVAGLNLVDSVGATVEMIKVSRNSWKDDIRAGGVKK